jgi:hypothetical protein
MGFCAFWDKICECVIIFAMVRISEDFGPWTMYMCVVITFAIVTMLRNFGPSGIEFMIVCYKRHHGKDIKGFWALWDNTYEFMLL